MIAYERAGAGESLLVILNFQNKDSVVKAPKGYGKKSLATMTVISALVRNTV